jgi:hypothetical protein
MQLRSIRRLVTAEDDQGRSYVAEDGESPSVRTLPERPGYRVINLWCTQGTPPCIDDPDKIATHIGLPPPTHGTLLRIVDYPPEPADEAERKRQQKATFEGLFNGTDHRPDSRHAGMHRTDTIDYAIVLEGEIVAIMDKGETVMRAGDVLIQRGTAHAWANRSGKPARVAFVLLDARR